MNAPNHSPIHHSYATSLTRQIRAAAERPWTKGCRRFLIALSITDLKLYFFLGETMKHEKEREGGRDNRHSRHIKTRQGDAAKAEQHRERESGRAGCGATQRGGGTHCRVSQLLTFISSISFNSTIEASFFIFAWMINSSHHGGFLLDSLTQSHSTFSSCFVM